MQLQDNLLITKSFNIDFFFLFAVELATVGQTPAPPAPACPPGLSYLSTIDQLLVHQNVELLEGIISKNS